MAKLCSVNDLKNSIDEGLSFQIIDVREHPEFIAEKISGSTFVPLSSLSKKSHLIDIDSPGFVICTRGIRASKAVKQLSTQGFNNLSVVEGGLEAWQKAGFPTERGVSPVWSMERQVRFTAGILIFLGSLLAWLIHVGFLIVPLFVGAGLVFSALTNTCNMAMILMKAPWNKEP